MKTLDTLIEDIHNLLEYGKEPTEQFVKEYAEAVAADVSNAMRSYLEDRKGTLRMSNVGRPCKRQLWYEANGVEGETITPEVKLRFMFGHLIEGMLLYLAKEAGHEVSHEQKEVEINGIVGHMDAVIDGYVVDVKSASPFAFQKFKKNTIHLDDAFGYIGQISGYAQALNKPAAFFAMDKGSCELAIAKVNTIDFEKLSTDVKAQVESTNVPDRGFNTKPDGKSGNMMLEMNCRYCAFKRTCFPTLRAFQYSNGIRYLTHVAKLPNVPEVKV
jgi:hypothetical protein